MKFSVIIPLYNKARYITSTVESALAQTFMDFEVIVIDDGSTDHGAELVAAISDPRLKLVRQSNAGVSVARNRGIALAQGEWVVFLDADDWHHPRYLATLLMAHQVCPQANTVACDFVFLPDRDENWPPYWLVADEPPAVEMIDDLASRWMRGPTLCTSAVTVRRELLQSMQPCFAPGESQGEDLDLWFRLAEQAPIALVRVPLMAYRAAVEGSLTSHHCVLSTAPFLQRMRARALSGAMTSAQAHSALQLVAEHEVTIAREALVAGSRLESLQWLFRSRRAAVGTRWWLTAAMVCLFPRHLVKRWQQWRVQRTAPSLDITQPG